MLERATGASEDTESFVRTVADRVKEYGPSFEQMVREKEKDNPKFDWLRAGNEQVS